MTHMYVEIPSKDAYAFLKAVSKWSGIPYDDTVVIPENTEFSTIFKTAENIVAQQVERARLAGQQEFDVNDILDTRVEIYDCDGTPTNFICRSIKDDYFWQGTNFLRSHPSENSHVVYNKCIQFIYVVKRLGDNAFEWATYFTQ